MPSGAGALHALEGVLPWLPVMLALSANSPYLAGKDTGFASNRGIVLSELPRSGAPPAFARWPEWEAYVERITAIGLPADYTALWWDVRPHPRFGTLELRMPDQPTEPALTAAFVALFQALCVTVLDGPRPDPDPAARAAYQQNRWAASRFGPRAELIDVRTYRKATAAELGRELLDLVGRSAAQLGTLELVGRLDPDRCEADRQLELGRADGLQALCADLVERTRV
jgi:carboxylate-amine ligase